MKLSVLNSTVKSFTPLIQIAKRFDTKGTKIYILRVGVTLPSGYAIELSTTGEPVFQKRVINDVTIMVVNISCKGEPVPGAQETTSIDFFTHEIASDDCTEKPASQLIVMIAYGDPEESSAASVRYIDADQED